MKTLGVEDFAKQAGVEIASARVMLRKVGVKKNGASYEFKSKDEIAKIIGKARSGKPAAEKKTKKVVKKTKKTAPKKKAKKEKAEPAAE